MSEESIYFSQQASKLDLLENEIFLSELIRLKHLLSRSVSFKVEVEI